MSFGSSPSPPPVPAIAQPQITQAPPTPPPTFGQTPTGTKPQSKPSQPSFLGSGLTATGTQLSKPSLIGSVGS